MIKIYISQANGKTLTAIGTALNEAENGNKVIFTQFLTDGEASELKMLQQNERVAVLLPDALQQEFRNLDEIQKMEVKQNTLEHYERIVNLVKTNCSDMLILDRILDVCDYGLVDCSDLVQFLKEIGNKMEIVLTGRRITHEVMEVIDYISDIRKINDVDEQCYVEISEKIVTVPKMKNNRLKRR